MRWMPLPPRLFWPTLLLCLACAALPAGAHPLIEDALDATASRQKLSIELRVAPEELSVDAGTGPGQAPSAQQRRAHAAYIAEHLRVEADGQRLAPTLVDDASGAPTGPLIRYRFEYPFARPPQIVRVEQTLLADREPWTVSCVLRFRQVDQPTFQTGLLLRGQIAEFGCDWSAAPAVSAPSKAPRDANAWPTLRAYAAHGVMHILTGYDHLLFVTALVLAATRLWDLVKVITAFTVAHTITLTLAVLGMVHLSDALVEPMIAASIVVVALQNLLWPRSSRGLARIAVAFAFGLFHGLGFAGGLRDAMGELPRSTLTVALLGFSLGVEFGHQLIVLPLFATMRLAQHPPRPRNTTNWCRGASAAICVAGVCFLVRVLRFF